MNDQAEKYEGAYNASMQNFDEGKAERDLEIARNLLKEKCDIAIIARITGLTIEQIKALQSKNVFWSLYTWV